MSLDEVQRELIQVKSEKSEAVRAQATTETKIEDLQVSVGGGVEREGGPTGECWWSAERGTHR